MKRKKNAEKDCYYAIVGNPKKELAVKEIDMALKVTAGTPITFVKKMIRDRGRKHLGITRVEISVLEKIEPEAYEFIAA
ncbi:MAG TPA: hypothetical protein VL576_00150 [Candidatus Paceibacterota bacterium]|jgi:hypothetical protein|nr:hypothetical protein [Candidatus Paceibacterota bacterium]